MSRGADQLVVRSVEVSGSGALHLAFDRLKKKLAGEGLLVLSENGRSSMFVSFGSGHISESGGFARRSSSGEAKASCVGSSSLFLSRAGGGSGGGDCGRRRAIEPLCGGWDGGQAVAGGVIDSRGREFGGFMGVQRGSCGAGDSGVASAGDFCGGS